MKTEKKKRKCFFDVKESKFANRLKRALPKFRGDRSQVRGVNGRSKFVAASAGRAERKRLWTIEHCLVKQISKGLVEELPRKQACSESNTHST